MIIKAGTYRWNDNPTPYDVTIGSATGMGLPFLLPEFSFVVQGQTVTLQFRGTDILLIKDASSKFYLVYDGSFVDENGGAISDGDFVSYTDTEGWNAFETLNDSVSNFDIIKTYLPDDYAKTFTIPNDTEVDDTFGTWFSDNTEPVAEETPAVEITYKGETILLNSGETVTLHTTEKKLTEDLVIRALV